MWNRRSHKVRIILSLTIALGIVAGNVLGQDIFDCKHSRVFADYLFLTQEYQRAANEYERILFSCDTMQVQLQLLRAYRLSGQYGLSFRQIDRLYPALLKAPNFVQDEYLKLLLLSARYVDADSILRKNALPQVDQQLFRLRLNLLTNQWKAASSQLMTFDSLQVPNRLQILQLTQQAQLFRPKSSLLAATLSGLVPGLGKVYARDRKDGLVSFIFIGSLAFQAYRSFDRHGSGSVAGWLFASAGLGFYVGNIYGSVKSARQYNERRLNQFRNGIKQLTFSTF